MSPNGKKQKDWAILIYMAADNDLANESVWALKSIQEVGTADGIAIAAQYDSPQRGRSTYRFTFDGDADQDPCGLSRRGEAVESTESTDQEGSAYSNSLRKFLEWGLESLDARNYALIISSHGGAPSGDRLLWDENPPRYLSIPRLRYALETALKTTKVDRLQLVGFDACAMSAVELGYELRHVARYMVAAEGFEPQSGWPYGQILQRLNAESTMGPENLAETIVGSYVDYYTPFSKFAGLSVELAATDLDLVEPVAMALENLGRILTGKLHALRAPLLTAHFDAQSFIADQYSDVHDLVGKLWSHTDDPEVRSACEGVIKAVEPCVLASRSCGTEFQHSNGLSIHFPWVEDAHSLSITDLFHPDEIRNPRVLARRLVRQAKAQGDSAGKTIWSQLDDSVQRVIEAIPDKDRAGHVSRAALASALNVGVNDMRLYDQERFTREERLISERTFPDGNWGELERLISRRSALTQSEVLRMNRLLLEVAFYNARSKQNAPLVEGSRYKKLLFNRRTGWSYFLSSYLSATRREPKDAGKAAYAALPSASNGLPTRYSSTSKFASTVGGIPASIKNRAVEHFCDNQCNK